MKKHRSSSSFVVWYGAGAATVIGLLAACGGKVTWVEDGATQSGGAGGTTSSTTSKATSSTKSVTSTNVSTVQQGTSIVATSIASTSNVMPGCDTGEFGDIQSDVCQFCIDCSINSECFGEYDAFNQSADAQEFLQCTENCGGPMCQQKCFNDHPMGAQIYNDLVQCVLCFSCPNNCDAASNCGGPPPPGTSGQGPGSGGGPPPN